jgi:glucans biosynthesis protein
MLVESDEREETAVESRGFVSACLVMCLMALGSDEATPQGTARVAPEPAPFTFAEVRRRAAALASRPFEDQQDVLPPAVRHLSYDQYRDIRFRPQKALWRDAGLSFQVQFFQRASFDFMDAPLAKVVINIVDQGHVVRVPYISEMFDFGRTVVTELPADLGFAGFRIHYPLHRADYYDEVAVFLGASYFRALGQQQHYGLSARGLAIDTGLAKAEEFPRFREFWLEKPQPNATAMTVYALLDGKSVTGAYQFTIRPGKDTVFEVKAHVFMRAEVEKIGFAPLTSMFFTGEGTERFFDDFRPEVHDSDGLLLATGHAEWLWRPLANPTRIRVSSFRDTNPRGFGLLQRDRDFDHYQDLESAYQTRPSVWIEPLGEWGTGAVQLVELPSDSEKHDNIVAFWVPAERAEAGKEWQFAYRMAFFLDTSGLPPGGRTYATRIGVGGYSGESEPDKRKFVIDFAGGRLSDLDPTAPVEAVVTASAGRVDNQTVQRNDFIDGWRVFFDLKPAGEAPVELRCFLKVGEDALTETWSYQWNPK